ncbi:MAG: helix-turn-helix domain-containing protein [Salinibacter sp.]
MPVAMTDEPDTSARERFSRDLRRIREEREVSFSTLLEATQVPESRLQAFEDGLLYEESRMNVVYLKAFVRTYAETVGLSPDSVVAHLEAALSGDYQNQLAVEYLDASPSAMGSASTSEEDSVPSDAETTGQSEDPPQDSDSSPTRGSEEDSTAEVHTGESNDAPVDPGGERGAEAVGGDPALSRDQSPSAKSTATGLGIDAVRTGGNGPSEYLRPLLYVASTIGLLALSAWGIATYVFTTDSPSGPPLQTRTDGSSVKQTTDTTQSADTARVDSVRATDAVASSSSAQMSSPPRLVGDTMYVTVVATSVVREMRVQQDDDLRRPYWIEEGKALVFPFTRRITIQNQLDSLRLLLERYPYPTTHTDAEGRVVITRDTVRDFADTLRSPPLSISASPDTVQIGSTPSASSDTTDGTP